MTDPATLAKRLRYLVEQREPIYGPALEAAATLTAQAERIRDLEQERLALRHSLAQEIAGCLKARGFWAGNGPPSDLITAVGSALASQAEQIGRLTKALRYARTKVDDWSSLSIGLAHPNAIKHFETQRALGLARIDAAMERK